jgi:hypothetical protein
LVDPSSPEHPYNLSTSPQSGRHPLNGDSEEISSDVDDNQMMIQTPVDSLPIVVPQHSSHFIQQQQQQHQLKRSQYPY